MGKWRERWALAYAGITITLHNITLERCSFEEEDEDEEDGVMGKWRERWALAC